jgi:exocyst complex protein 7
LSRLLKLGNQQLEAVFRRILQEDAAPVEPLAYITKEKPFPLLSQDKTTRLGLINSVVRQTQDTGQIYASVRGPYLLASLSNLAAASINTAKKKNAELYRQGTNGIGSYAKGIEGAFVAEFDNICALFPRDEWRRVFTLTCQTSMNELSKTLKELNLHIRGNLTTDCFLGYEIIEIISNLSTRIETRTGELKSQFASALKPIRDTGRSSLAELLEDIRRRVGNLQSLPTDGALPITTEIVARLQTMVDFLRPVSSIMISLGDGNWKNVNTTQSNDSIPSLKSFDISADGKDLFAHYSIDTIDTLLSSLDQKGRLLLKGKPVLGVFLANNLAVIQRMIRNSDLGSILSSRASGLDVWRKKVSVLYIDPWNDLSRILMEAQHITRSAPKGRPPSGSATDSATVVKGLSSKERDAIKEKFRQFNTTFDELVARHKTMPMEREVKEMFGKEVQVMVEPLYGRFWDRYHELDKGKGKYVKYDKAGISSICASLV